MVYPENIVIFFFLCGLFIINLSIFLFDLPSRNKLMRYAALILNICILSIFLFFMWNGFLVDVYLAIATMSVCCFFTCMFVYVCIRENIFLGKFYFGFILGFSITGTGQIMMFLGGDTVAFAGSVVMTPLGCACMITFLPFFIMEKTYRDMIVTRKIDKKIELARSVEYATMFNPRLVWFQDKLKDKINITTCYRPAPIGLSYWYNNLYDEIHEIFISVIIGMGSRGPSAAIQKGVISGIVQEMVLFKTRSPFSDLSDYGATLYESIVLSSRKSCFGTVDVSSITVSAINMADFSVVVLSDGRLAHFHGDLSGFNRIDFENIETMAGTKVLASKFFMDEKLGCFIGTNHFENVLLAGLSGISGSEGNRKHPEGKTGDILGASVNRLTDQETFADDICFIHVERTAFEMAA
ncbi:MAG: hypothetical protein HQK54_13005 [Oligoflexales bacterium]|nr:hypothetical protein [Oligoflexales bacterium]